MAHAVIIENADGEVVDVNYYCSDYCAQDDKHYAGWNGCHEIHDSPKWCASVSCEEPLGFYSGDQWIRSEDQNRWLENGGLED